MADQPQSRAVLQRFTDFAIESSEILDVSALQQCGAAALVSVPSGICASAVLTVEDGHAVVSAAVGPGMDAVVGRRWEEAFFPGRALLADHDVAEVACAGVRDLLPDEANVAGTALIVPLRDTDRLIGAAYAFSPDTRPLAAETRGFVQIISTRIAVTLQRAWLHAALEQRNRQLSQILDITSQIAQSLEFATLAPQIVRGVTEVTDFRVATLTLRDGQVCRRIAASGLEDPALGRETPFAAWEELLREEFRRGETAYLIPPGTAAPSTPRAAAAQQPADPTRWLADHALTVVLRDQEDTIVGFLSVDEPRSGRLPGDRTVDILELFSRQVQVAFVNARLYSEAKQASQRDSLTGLRNRAAFWEDLPAVLAAAGPKRPVALAIVDADHFKAVNDQHGHVVGDQVLGHLADRLQRSVRQTDRVYRVGGEEFTVLMPETTAANGRIVMNRARQAVSRTRADLPPVTISAGIGQFPDDAVGPDALYQAADEALFHAKRDGRDRVSLAH